MTRLRNEKGVFVKTHGHSKTKLYGVWCAMKRRCYYLKDKRYQHYGGRGIIVCEEWKQDYKKFESWAIANGYKPGLSIDRINNNGNYCPSNCRWTTTREQNRNYSKNRLLEFCGKLTCLQDIAHEIGIKPSTLRQRIKRNVNKDKLFEQGDLRYGKRKK